MPGVHASRNAQFERIAAQHLNLSRRAHGTKHAHALDNALGTHKRHHLLGGKLPGLGELLDGSELVASSKQSLQVLLGQMDMTTGHANAHGQRGGMSKKVLDLLLAPNAQVKGTANKTLDLLGTHSRLVPLMVLGLMRCRRLMMLGRGCASLVLRRCGRSTKDQLDAQLGGLVFGLRGHDSVAIDCQHATVRGRRLHVRCTDQSFRR